MKKESICLFILILSFVGYSQNLNLLSIEKNVASSFVIPESCSPEHLIIVINSSIPDLKFESNMLPDNEFKVVYMESVNQYIICHEKIKFKLTIKGVNLQSEDIDIMDLNEPLFYTVSSNNAKGTINIITNPRNSTLIFPGLNNLTLSSNNPITNISGKYNITIVKPEYQSIETTITIPRNAEQTYFFDLKPEFPMIRLKIETEDQEKITQIPEILIDSINVPSEGLVGENSSLRSFFDGVIFNKIYEDKIIPVKEGEHKMSFLVTGYKKFETKFKSPKGEISDIVVKLEPEYGQITVLDSINAEGADIYIDGIKSGQVPTVLPKVKVGEKTITLSKPGYLPFEQQYKVTLKSDEIKDLKVAMYVAKKLKVNTIPTNSEVILNGTRLGFTPLETHIYAGNHKMIINKNGFASENHLIEVTDDTKKEFIYEITLKQISTLQIFSEQEGMKIRLYGKKEVQNIIFSDQYTTNTNIPAPFGDYKLNLLDNNTIVLSKKIHHDATTKQKVFGVYSKSSFHSLYFNSFLNSLGQSEYEAGFGRFIFINKSGISTSIAQIENRIYSIARKNSDGTIYKENISAISPFVIFTNWDWRLGGSIIRQIDIAFLGQIKFSPGLIKMGFDNLDFNDIENFKKSFLGIELSSRLPYLNAHFRFGQQFYSGKVLINNNSKIEKFPIENKKNDWTVSLGLSLSGKVSKSNNILRLWY